MKIIVTLLLLSILAFAEDTAPIVNLSVAGINEPAQFVKTINIAVILTLMALAPTLLLMVTSFTRIIIVFSLLRQAMGLQQTPPTQIIISLSLILRKAFSKTGNSANALPRSNFVSLRTLTKYFMLVMSMTKY